MLRSHRRTWFVVTALLAVSAAACDDDSPTVGTVIDEETTVDEVTGTVLPASSNPDQTDAPNPNAGGGGANLPATTGP